MAFFLYQKSVMIVKNLCIKKRIFFNFYNTNRSKKDEQKIHEQDILSKKLG